jgi:putative heme transporter
MQAKSQVTTRTVWIVGLNILAMTGVLTVAYQTREVIAWILVALFVALALNPAVKWLALRGVPRGVAVGGVLLAATGILALLVGTMVPVLVEQGRGLVKAGPDMLERLRESRLVEWVDSHAGWLESAKRELGVRAGGAARPIFRFVGGLFTGLLAALTVTVLTIFMLMFGGDLFHGALEWIAPDKRPRYVMLAGKIHHAVGGYVSGALLIALIGGVVTTITLVVAGVPYFLPLGLLMTFLGLVPFLGAILGGALVVGITFLSAGTQAGVITLVVFLIYQQAENHLLQPLVQRRTIKMNPLLIATIMLLGTALAGVLGALLALPMAGAIQVVLADVLERRNARWHENMPERGIIVTPGEPRFSAGTQHTRH